MWHFSPFVRHLHHICFVQLNPRSHSTLKLTVRFSFEERSDWRQVWGQKTDSDVPVKLEHKQVSKNRYQEYRTNLIINLIKKLKTERAIWSMREKRSKAKHTQQSKQRHEVWGLVLWANLLLKGAAPQASTSISPRSRGGPALLSKIKMSTRFPDETGEQIWGKWGRSQGTKIWWWSLKILNCDS